ncbi:MAG: hypothetical protein B6D77_05585 [gamma proteobacterium symbiont of Ctena orbiculata]|nr:MAG: hypothetical protein B6D77_05585 [gamma proteobacterium symbiont of Ctena orbiculata]PVV18745.1 MAG: hypothetical protein B6D78_15455 [gamma proteobacterium symbiont of Ctena orbiculata]
MSERMHFSVDLGKKEELKHPRKPANGYTIVLLGAFGGGTGTGNPVTETSLSLHSIEIETIDELITKLQPSISFALDGESIPSITLTFNSLDDFHPDGLLEQLADHQISNECTDEVPVFDAKSEEIESQQETLSRLLGARPLSAEQRRGAGPSLSDAKQSMITDVVRRLAENAADRDLPMTADAQAAAKQSDTDKTLLLRSLLHHDAFQKLEAGWRSVDWLMHNIEPDPAIRCYLLNISRTELEQECSSHVDATSSALYHRLRDAFERNDLLESSFILIDNHEYGPDQESVAMLNWLGSLAGGFAGTLLAGSNSSFLNDQNGTGELYNEWQSFRKQSSATNVALLYPQVLLRLPYGSATDPIQSQAFEELDEKWSIEDLLWGNPAYALAILLIRQWTVQGDREQVPILTDLPAYSYPREGEHHLQPCTKRILHEQQIDQLLGLGIIPVIGSRNRNAIQLPWFQHLGQSSNA